MAGPNDPNEPTLPPKRKSDPDLQDLPSKIAKLATPDLKQTHEPQPTADHITSQPPTSSSDPKEPDKEFQNDDVEENNPLNDDEEHQNDVEDEDDDDDDDDDDDEEEEEEEDRKGKGISREDKGKGKMVQEDEDDDDSDDDSDDDASDDDGSDFSDDPLTEVDLNNILPSRTRGRTGAASAGVRISDDSVKAAVGGLGDDDDDSDDSDA